MTNAEKYKTANERAEAFRRWCEMNHSSINGPQAFMWLDLEAPIEKQLPCPFCGMVCDFHSESGGIDRIVWNVKCRDPLCGYHSALKDTREEAITEHNRIARVVMAKKEVEK